MNVHKLANFLMEFPKECEVELDSYDDVLLIFLDSKKVGEINLEIETSTGYDYPSENDLCPYMNY